MNNKIIYRQQVFTGRARLVFGFSLLALFAFCSFAEAQKFDLEAYLNKIDVNRNGLLDGSELSDRTKGFLRKLGIDTDKPVSIKKVISKVKKDRKNAEGGKKSTTGRTRQVPGFGVEAAQSSGVARFSASSTSSTAASQKAPAVSDSVKERVQSTLDRYDRNKDGLLDASEISRARWGSPSPDQSDTNKDGKLSRKELERRYIAREQYYRSSSSSSSASRDQAKKEAEERARRERERERFRTSGITSSTRSSYSSSTPGSSGRSSGSSSSSADSRAKYEKYAESLIGNYDKDKDGKLNKDEIKQMRRPPVGADTDKDGFVTKSELLNSLSGANKSTTSSTSGKSDAKSSTKYAGKTSSYSSKRSSSSRSGSSSSFDKLDANEDKHVHMHEYSDDWDDETIAEFYEKDKNGDGVITLREWSTRN